MRTWRMLAAMAALILALTGCVFQTVPNPLVGTWLDLSGTDTFTFNADYTFSEAYNAPPLQVSTGTYSVDQAAGDLTLNYDSPSISTVVYSYLISSGGAALTLIDSVGTATTYTLQ